MKKAHIAETRMPYIRLWKRALLCSCTDPREGGLNAFIKKIALLSDPKFLTKEEASLIVEAVKRRIQKKKEKDLCKKKILLRSLSPDQRGALKRRIAFRRERDEVLRLLRNLGASYPMLSEISGLGKNQIMYIVLKEQNGRRYSK